MKKKQRVFFNLLETLPEVIQSNCEKDVRQLRSFYEEVERHWPYADEEMYKKITRKVIKLQTIISDNNIKNQLRSIQSKCDKRNNRQEYEQLADFHDSCYDSSGWCGVDYEY